MTVFIINLLAYILWFCYAYRKDRTITLYNCMILLIAFVALAGVYVIYSGIYFDTFDKHSLKNIDPTPFVLTFIGFVACFHPLKYAKLRNVDFAEFKAPTFKFIVYAWIVLSIVYSIIKLSEAIAAISLGLDIVYEARHVNGETLSYMMYSNQLILKIRWIGGIVTNATCPLMMLYGIFCLINSKKKVVGYLILLLTFLPSFFNSIAIGSRGAMLWSFLKLLFIFLLTNKFLSSNLKKRVLFFLLLGLSSVLLYSVVITMARFENTDSLSSILRYFGEPFPNMSFSYWDRVINHPMGERFFPDLFDRNLNKLSPAEIHNYWTNITGVPILNWKILYCDCYIEYGKIGGLIFLFILGFLFGCCFKYYKLGLYNVSILFFYYEICDSSFTGYNAFSNVITTTFISILVLNCILYFGCKLPQNPHSKKLYLTQ